MGRDQHVHRVPPRGQQGRPHAYEQGSPLLALYLRTAMELQDLADWINPIVRGDG